MQLVANTVALLVGCGLAAAAVPPTTHLVSKRHDNTYCRSHCSLAGVPMPDQDTIQLPLENFWSEQCPPIVASPIGAPQVTSKVCLTFLGTSMDFIFAPFAGYKITSAAVTWKLKGNQDTPSSWTPAPPTHPLICTLDAASGGASCCLPFGTIFPPDTSSDRDLLDKMCPNGDREALTFYLQFSGYIQSVYGGPYIPFVQQYPCSSRSNRLCTAWNRSYNYIEAAYRCTKCDASPCWPA